MTPIYVDRSHLSPKERECTHYDHPDALETSLLVRHLQELREERPVGIPVYDFTTHSRKGMTKTICPKKVIMVEGISILADAALCELMHIQVFVDTGADTRFIRRLQRDIAERGRTMQSVMQQYLSRVKPMHLDLVKPSKRYADIIMPEGGYNQVVVDTLITKIRSIIQWP